MLSIPMPQSHSAVLLKMVVSGYWRQWTNRAFLPTCLSVAKIGDFISIGSLSMPMTRPRAQSSFTVEIKRSSRRVPEVFTLNKMPSLRRSSLAEQVFSKSSGRPLSAQIDRPVVQAASQQTLSSPPILAAAPEPQAQPSPRRILPDLLSVPVDPVAERIKQEAEERALRYRAVRKVRQRKSREAPAARPFSKTSAPLPAVPQADISTAAVTGLQTVTPPVQRVQVVPRTRWNVLAARAKRAEREGRSMPRLPAGQRWKRRLPTTCW